MRDTTSERDRLAPNELTEALGHYHLGTVASAKEFPHGSRRAPKVLIETERGVYLLKRRARGQDDPFKVAFAHALVQHLRSKRFPVPALIGTRDDDNTMLQLRGHVYEVFAYLDGRRYDESLKQTAHAGRTLARYHRAVEDFGTEWIPPRGSYHRSASVGAGLNAIPNVIAGHADVSGHETELLRLVQTLRTQYDQAGETVERGGFSLWPASIIHGDWHPGNLLYRGPKVLAVLDFDVARFQPPIIDIACGMLQFSIIRGTSTPDQWPDFFDVTRMRRFLAGYLSVEEVPDEQRRVVPDLMIEGLIAEAVLPVAASGYFGNLPGFGVLQMVGRKVRWLLGNADQIRGHLLG